MRLHPPAPFADREAAQDDVIPLAVPVIGKNGQPIQQVYVKKGQYIHVSIREFNLSKDIFGDDASEFRPERWLEEDLASKVRGMSVWSPLLNFLGGPCGCIGIKFAVCEIAVMLFKLVDAFEFTADGVPLVSSLFMSKSAIPSNTVSSRRTCTAS